MSRQVSVGDGQQVSIWERATPEVSLHETQEGLYEERTMICYFKASPKTLTIVFVSLDKPHTAHPCVIAATNSTP